MAKDPTLRTVLGYHRAGEFFYFTVFSGSSWSLGTAPDERYTDVPSFAGLVTAVHEHHHLMQDLSQGFFWWRQTSRDLLVVILADILRKHSASPIRFPIWQRPKQIPREFDARTAGPFGPAMALAIQLDAIDYYLESANKTEELLRHEIRTSPELAAMFGDELFQLTTLDLVECQAAILTELYISKLLVEQPDKFNSKVAGALDELFRVDKMPVGYLRPLRAMLHVFNAVGLQLQPNTENAHPLYSQIKHGFSYVLLSFLLDYALHLPPNPTGLLTNTPDIACQQDIYPPFRFINLLMLCALELKLNRRGLRSSFTSESAYYSSGAPALAKLVNDMHSVVRKKRFFQKSVETFYSIDHATRMWIEYFKANPMQKLFKIPYDLLSKCVTFRLEYPDFFLRLAPFDFDSTVGLPKVFITKQGLRTFPYVTGLDGMPEGNLKEYLTRGLKTHYEGFVSDRIDRDAIAQFPPTLVPMRFVEAWMQREMSFRFASMILHEGRMRCPLTESIGRGIPCRSRTQSCEDLTDPEKFPIQDCLLRDTVSTSFGGLKWHGDGKRI